MNLVVWSGEWRECYYLDDFPYNGKNISEATVAVNGAKLAVSTLSNVQLLLRVDPDPTLALARCRHISVIGLPQFSLHLPLLLQFLTHLLLLPFAHFLFRRQMHCLLDLLLFFDRFEDVLYLRSLIALCGDIIIFVFGIVLLLLVFVGMGRVGKLFLGFLHGLLNYNDIGISKIGVEPL